MSLEKVGRRHLLARSTALWLGVILLSVSPSATFAQDELRPERQIAVESGRGTLAVKQDPTTKRMYVLNRLDRCVWIYDAARKMVGRISSAGMGPADLFEPVDFAVDRGGNVIVADGLNAVKIFSPDGHLLRSFPFFRPRSVAVLGDGRILVSGFPRDSLMSVFDLDGRPIGSIGTPAQDDEDPFFNSVLNLGKIVVDDSDYVYYVFRHRFIPTVRKYTPNGQLIAEWHPQGGILQQISERATEEHLRIKAKPRKDYGARAVLYGAAFDPRTGMLWVAAGNQLTQLDNSGKTLRYFLLSGLLSGGLQADTVVVGDESILVGNYMHGLLEFRKPN